MSLKRYEYNVIDPALWCDSDAAQIEEHLNSLGREGWEIVGPLGGDWNSDNGLLCFAKRKVKTHRKHEDE